MNNCKPKKIYMACPYTHENKEVMEERFKKANENAGMLMKLGYLVFSPISHIHPIAVCCELPRDFKFWEQYDMTFIDWADEVWVLAEPGWNTSQGVAREIKYAKKTGKDVRFF